MSRLEDKKMTRVGYLRIASEHRELLEDVRPKIVEGITIAAAEGDRSENAEYIYGKKRLREIDKKLRYLSNLMADVTVIDPEFIRSHRVEFGATVTILEEGGIEKKWAIVGVGEADVGQGKISYKSPIAAALINRKVGDFVLVEIPSGEVELEIVRIEYLKIN